jgi:hypothetical protein
VAATGPWFLRDTNVSEDELRARLRHPDALVRAQWQGVVMREARYREVFDYLTLEEITRDFEYIERHVGRRRAFWIWLLEGFRRDGFLPAA